MRFFFLLLRNSFNVCYLLSTFRPTRSLVMSSLFGVRVGTALSELCLTPWLSHPYTSGRCEKQQLWSMHNHIRENIRLSKPTNNAHRLWTKCYTLNRVITAFVSDFRWRSVGLSIWSGFVVGVAWNVASLKSAQKRTIFQLLFVTGVSRVSSLCVLTRLETGLSHVSFTDTVEAGLTVQPRRAFWGHLSVVLIAWETLVLVFIYNSCFFK